MDTALLNRSIPVHQAQMIVAENSSPGSEASTIKTLEKLSKHHSDSLTGSELHKLFGLNTSRCRKDRLSRSFRTALAHSRLSNARDLTDPESMAALSEKNIIRISESEKAELLRKFDQFDFDGDADDNMKNQLRSLLCYAAPSLFQRLREFGEGHHADSTLLIKGLPSNAKNLEKITLAIGEALVSNAPGECFIEDDYVHDGDKPKLVQTIEPNKKHESDQTSSNSKVDLDPHIENLGIRRPDWLIISCSKNNEKAKTTLVKALKPVYRMLKAGKFKEVLSLFGNHFNVFEPDNVVRNRNDGSRTHKSIAIARRTLFPGFPDINLDYGDDMVPLEKGRSAYNELRSFVDQAIEEVALEEGDALIIRNGGSSQNHFDFYSQAMHGRRAFKPLWGENRKIHRLYIERNDKPDVRRTRHYIRSAPYQICSLANHTPYSPIESR